MAHQIRLKSKHRFVYAGMLALTAVVVTTPASHAQDSFKGAARATRLEADSAPAVDTQPTRVAAKHVYLGRAPYVCTPSGYGEKAHCVLRARAEAAR
jgi:hypothetical protein